VQNLIADDPSIIGLGDLVLRDQERIQPRAGRLDLLLQDPDTQRRYEVELQLGGTDESHIIRTLEYWDIERKRYPQYDHCAVLIAEDITSRFLNVISLFNGTIPLIAIQLQAMQVGDHTTLVFTTVLDEMTRGVIDDDDDAQSAPTDRQYWEARATTGTVALADKLLALFQNVDQGICLKYNKFYIGIEKDGQPFNFVIFRPKKNHLNLSIKLEQSDAIDEKLEQTTLSVLEYDRRWRNYRLQLAKDDIEPHKDLFLELAQLAYDKRANNRS
jgi:predicted transport protein